MNASMILCHNGLVLYVSWSKLTFLVGFVIKNADDVGLDFQGFIATSVSAVHTDCKGEVAFSPVDDDIISFALPVLEHQNVPHTVMFAVGEEFVTGVNRDGLVLVVFCWSKLGRSGQMVVSENTNTDSSHKMDVWSKYIPVHL